MPDGRVYYNEHDPFAAAWLRSLIATGSLPAGDVDERDIRDVLPSDLDGYAACHFFAGIGGWAYALDLAGWPRARPVWTGSCPCQPFSAAGRRGGLLTSGTYGPRSSTSSTSADLQRSLESRLRARMASLGSTLFTLTWKVRVTPSGRPICQLRASGRRTSDSDCGSWPTPTAINRIRDEETMTKCLAVRKRRANQNTVPLYLGEVAAMATDWATPAQRDWKGATLERWGTNARPLNEQVRLAPWATPSASGFEAKDVDRMLERREECRIRTGNGNGFGMTIGQQVHLVTGTILNGSPAATEKRVPPGQINPRFSGWLMGYPDAWCQCAPKKKAASSRLQSASKIASES